MKGNPTMPSKSKVEAANSTDAYESDVDTAFLASAPDDWEFETVESPTRLILETIGDSFVGQFEGTQTIPLKDGGSFEMFLFRGRDGVLYSINASAKLREARDSFNVGSWVRLTYVADIDTGQETPMKDIKVEVKRG